MITLTDCIGLYDLSPAEIQALEEHEHVPEIIAASLGNYLVHSIHGPEKIRDIILDDVGAAFHRGDLAHARHLVSVLKTFLQQHPEAACSTLQ